MCGCLSCVPPTGDLACNPGMCPDWELNGRPYGLQASAQFTEPNQSGLQTTFYNIFVLFLFVTTGLLQPKPLGYTCLSCFRLLSFTSSHAPCLLHPNKMKIQFLILSFPPLIPLFWIFLKYAIGGDSHADVPLIPL